MSSAPPRSRFVAAAAETAQAIAERHGGASERPALRSDAVVRRQIQMGEARWWVKNTETLKYYIFYDFEWRLIELMDGTRTRPEIVAEYNTLYPFDPIDVGVILDYEEMLRKIDLLAQSATQRNLELLGKLKTARQRAAQEKAEGFNPFFMLFHVLDPDRFLDRTVKYVRWIWSPPVVAVWAVAIAWTVCVFALHFTQLLTGTYELYAFLRKPFLDAVHFFFILSFVGFFHEFGHAYAVKIYGGEVHDIGLALLYFTPAFYCDTTDALLFENKWQRLWVNTAGIYVEGFVCSAATALWVFSYPDSLIHDLAYKTMLFTGISTIFFNINPLIKIDGYHALTSVLEMPDLREDAFRHIGAVFQKYVLRLPVTVTPASHRRRRIYWVYGTLALAYIGVIMALITRIFFNLYNRILPDFAVVLIIVTVVKIFQKRVRLVTRTARLFYLDKKEWLMSRKARPALAAAGVAVVLLLVVPWSRRVISAEGVLRPQGVARIEAPEDGWVEQVFARESDGVAAGAPVLRLVSQRAVSDEAALSAQKDRLEKQAGAARDQSLAEALYESEQRQSAVRVGLVSERARNERLTLRAPFGGRVMTPRMEDLRGRFVAAHTLLSEIGDCRTLVADLPVSERLLSDIRPGFPVKALARQQPLGSLRGKVSEISAATLDRPATPSGLSDPAAPRELPDRFAVRAVFDNAAGGLRPGDRIRAKIYCGRESLARGAWRVVWRWLRSVAW